jgi:hypothetical protein
MRYLSATICPGVNLPPPIAPELDGGRDELEDACGDWWDGLFGEEGAFGMEGGAMVSPSKTGELSTRVSAALGPNGSPQFGQNLPLSETAFLHAGHNMKRRF